VALLLIIIELSSTRATKGAERWCLESGKHCRFTVIWVDTRKGLECTRSKILENI